MSCSSHQCLPTCVNDDALEIDWNGNSNNGSSTLFRTHLPNRILFFLKDLTIWLNNKKFENRAATIEALKGFIDATNNDFHSTGIKRFLRSAKVCWIKWNLIKTYSSVSWKEEALKWLFVSGQIITLYFIFLKIEFLIDFCNYFSNKPDAHFSKVVELMNEICRWKITLKIISHENVKWGILCWVIVLETLTTEVARECQSVGI